MLLLTIGTMACAAGGCAREPLEVGCLDEGSITVSELRRDQNDSYHDWVELHNTGEVAVTLGGLEIFTRSVESDYRVVERALLILDGGKAVIPPGGYAVVGANATGSKPFLTYGWDWDNDRLRTGDGDAFSSEESFPDLFPVASGTLELRSCGATIAQVDFTLPELGTLAFDGAEAPPTGEMDEAADGLNGWCNDLRESEEQSVDIIGLPGSPAQANPPCVDLMTPDDGGSTP